ncbi:hypothetical protein HK096_002564, partial [Nowakowskiella sp. JEL0078]
IEQRVVPPTDYQPPPQSHNRTNSDSSSAIRSEVSNLYRLGARTAPHVPLSQDLPPLLSSPLSRRLTSELSRADFDTRSVSFKTSMPEKSFPLGLVLFIAGFILFPIWWFGAVRPDETRWQFWNRLMTLLSVVLLGLAVGFVFGFTKVHL